MKRIKIEDQLIHALRNDKNSWIHAWQINHVKKTELIKIQKQVDKIISAIDGKNDGHQRELLKVLLKLNLTDDQLSLLWDICLRIWLDIQKQSSVRISAYKILVNTAKKFKPLSDELVRLTEEKHITSLSNGIRNSTYKNLLSELI
ncbi:MAG: hypothetical protein VXY28_08365 [Bacteroidota bacterium]|nr:hypothetical protein [Bacteroidota bacterium]